MTAKSVLKMGNKKLASPSLPIESEDFATSKIFDIIQNMRDTMIEKGGVGIAAPQIGYNYRIILFGFEHSERYQNEKPVPLTILINPTYEALSDEMVDGWEGCLSVPELRGLVPRYRKIKYSGFDPKGNLISRTAENFHARVVQHEYDHLEGILFPQRIKDLRFFGFEEEIWETIYSTRRAATL